MSDILLDNPPTPIQNSTEETNNLLFGPFIDPRNITYPALELQIFALEMGYIGKKGFDHKKIKDAINKYVLPQNRDSENHHDGISIVEVNEYFLKNTPQMIAGHVGEILAKYPNLETNLRLSDFSGGSNIQITDAMRNSTYYKPFSPLYFSLVGFREVAAQKGVGDIYFSDAFNSEVDKNNSGGIELVTHSVFATANYFKTIFSHFGIPVLGHEKYIEMASQAILAHEMMHANLHSMETSLRTKSFVDFLKENATNAELEAIKSRIEVMSFLMDELGEDGIQIAKGADYGKKGELLAKIRTRFVKRYGEADSTDGVGAFRQKLFNPHFDLWNYVDIINYSDAKVDFIFEPLVEKMISSVQNDNVSAGFSGAKPTELLRAIGDNKINDWYQLIWEKGSIPEMARSIVHRLPENIAQFVPQLILGEQLPSTVERVVYAQLLESLLSEEQIKELFKKMDESSFQPILRMYPILFDLIERQGLSLEEYSDFQSRASDQAISPYSCIKDRYSDEVEEQYRVSLTNPVLLLGYLVRLEPDILNLVQL